MDKLQAPPIRELFIDKLAANFAQISWDRIGSNFRYEVQMSAGESEATLGEYRRLGYTDKIYWFADDSTIQPNRYYKFRVRAVFKDFDPGAWTESDLMLSFARNSYAYDTQEEYTLSAPFKENFFALNDKTYLDTANDKLYATLVRPGYVFDPAMEWATEAGASFVTNNGFQSKYGKVPLVCKDTDRVIPTVIDDVIYAFERFQGVCKVSNDGGVTWNFYKALSGRAGNPLYNQIAQQNTTNTFVLGWDTMYQGIRSLDLTFDEEREFWSTVDFTFEKLDVENNFGFDTERFTPLAPLPEAIRNYTESFAVDDYQCIVLAEDKLYEYNIRIPDFDLTPGSPTEGEKIFSPIEYRVTGQTDAVMYNAVFYKDPDIGTDLGTFYMLVPGVWERNQDINSPDYGMKERIDYTHPIKGVYKMNRTPHFVVNPEFNTLEAVSAENPEMVIDYFTIDGFTRVYGNTEEERNRIDEYSTLSRDEKQLLLGVNYDKWAVVDEPNPDPNYHEVRFYKQQLFTTYQKVRTQALGSRNGSTWTPTQQDYYGSPEFNYMARSGTRDFKDWAGEIIHIRPLTVFTVPFNDLTDQRWSYNFTEGVHRFEIPDLTITDFSGYTEGALIHNELGRMLGYYKFPYRINQPAEIQWVPARHMMTASLTDYAPQIIEPDPEDPTTKINPDISHLIYKMAPESYLSDTGLYKKFMEYYLKFLSTGDDTPYQNLVNLLASQDPLSPHHTEYLYKEIYARNKILDADTREAVTRFFLQRRSDFYSTKGIIDSYKFLFKLLYDEVVDIEVESLNRFEYYIIATSDDITDDIVGRRIFTPTGSADVTHYERDYDVGVLRWKLTLNNLIGEFKKGQNIQNTTFPSFAAQVVQGVTGDTTNYNSDDFKNRSNAYYTMKIRSELQSSQYKDDVIRFVHPLGFDFIGITLLTVLINQGLSITHTETIVNFFRNIRMDSGAGTQYPELYPRMDRSQDNPQLEFDANGVLIEIPHPKAGIDPLVDQGISETQYNNLFNNSMLWGLTPYQRRTETSATMDVSWVRVSELIAKYTDKLKDNIGNPYDPEPPTQIRVQKDG